MPRIVKAGVFKAECLKMMEEVRQTSVSIWITKYGKPIAKLLPIEDKSPSVFERMKGTVEIKGDIIQPIEEKWDAES